MPDLQPPDSQRLFKIMKASDFVRSISGSYLHFQRVDHYRDFPTADERDGEQPARGRAMNAGMYFEHAPHYSAADYYDNMPRSRASFVSEAMWKTMESGTP
jgi:hypothetical protein